MPSREKRLHRRAGACYPIGPGRGTAPAHRRFRRRMTEETLILRHPKLFSLHAYWKELGGGRPPLASALDPSALRPWLGNLLVMDVKRETEFVYSYYGQSFADAFGVDKVGQTLASLPEPQGDILRAEYERVRIEKRPAARIYTADFDGLTSTWERLVLPLSDNGNEVTKLLVGAYRLEQPSVVPISAPRAP
jgi:hypothetical protein